MKSMKNFPWNFPQPIHKGEKILNYIIKVFFFSFSMLLFKNFLIKIIESHLIGKWGKLRTMNFKQEKVRKHC